MRKLRMTGALGALILATGVSVALATPAQATGPDVLKATIKDSPDDGCPAWARDTFTRTTTITAAGEGKYKVAIVDKGTFVTQKDAATPGDPAATIQAEATGTITGSGEFTVTGTLIADLKQLDGKVFDNSGYACKSNVPAERTTGNWPKQFFTEGAQVSGIDPWTWTYKTACEERTESSAAAAEGNITGKVCPTPPATTPPATRPAADPTTPPAGAGGGLPVTGAPILVIAGAGVLLVLAGGGALMLLRRRATFES